MFPHTCNIIIIVILNNSTAITLYPCVCMQLFVRDLGISGWWGVNSRLKDEWSFVTTTHGGLSVTMDLVYQMQQSCVGS